LLGELEIPSDSAPAPARMYETPGGENPCPNPTCISRTEDRHVRPNYRILSRHPLRAACGFCDQELEFTAVGSVADRRWAPPDSGAAGRLGPAGLLFLRDAEQARLLGFEPA
jgi:hypothetical protein